MSATGVTARELVEKLRSRDQRLPFEIGAFVALETLERLLDEPAAVGLDDVRIGLDGTLITEVAPDSTSGPEVAKSVAALMAHLLVAAGPGVPPALLRLVEDGSSDGRWDPTRMRDELEASLVPLNRAAARRVLARIVRELDASPRTSAHAPALSPLQGEVDDDLDALLAVGEPDEDEEVSPSELPRLDSSGNPVVSFESITAKRTGLRAAKGAEVHGALGERLQRATGDDVATAGRVVDAKKTATPARDEERSPSARSDVPTRAVSRGVERGPSRHPGAGVSSEGLIDGFVEETTRAKKSGFGRGPVMLLLLAVIGGGAAVALRPELMDRVLGREANEGALRAAGEERRSVEHADPLEPPRAEVQAPRGRLSIRVEGHYHAQIFLFVGRGPALAENLPTGVAHELVAVADGRAPTRAVVPADAVWASSDDGMLYELAMQTGDDEMTFEQLVLGPSRLDRDALDAPSGGRGRLRVVTTPPGARVFRLVGFGAVELADLPVDTPQEVLVYDEGAPPVRSFVGPSDWREGDEGHEAELVVMVPELRR